MCLVIYAPNVPAQKQREIYELRNRTLIKNSQWHEN